MPFARTCQPGLKGHPCSGGLFHASTKRLIFRPNHRTKTALPFKPQTHLDIVVQPSVISTA
jgi:hypothetical protein